MEKKLNTHLFRSKCRTGGAVSFINKKKKLFFKKKVKNKIDNQSILGHLRLFGTSGTKENLVRRYPIPIDWLGHCGTQTFEHCPELSGTVLYWLDVIPYHHWV